MNNSLLGLQRIKVVALGVTDLDRANNFYGNVLGLPPSEEEIEPDRWVLGDIDILLKADWQAPTADPNPRLTIEVDDSRATAAALKERGVVIADAVQLYEDKFYLGSFLDSEGNKFWLCSRKRC